MSAAKFVKGGASPNPAGRPTRAEAMMRKVKPTLIALGANEREIAAMGIAFADKSMEGVQIVMGIICMRFDAAQQAEVIAKLEQARPASSTESPTWQGEPDGDIF